TGAEDTPGVFELAYDGVLFLDEITEIDPSLQAELLRVIQEREFERNGSSRKIPFRGKLLASTNRPLKESLEAESFRKDLYFRFGAYVINVPPLRDRREDIPALARHLLARKSMELKRPMREFDEATMTDLCRRDWPGNVRELENAIVAYVVRGSFRDTTAFEGESDDALSGEALYRMSYRDAKTAVLREFQRKYTDAVIAACGGNLGETARRMGLTRFGLQKILGEIKK
ncbi:MAG: sigma 54-interacting transcriptional regulator, partial [Candidatus Krumholzibacteria bacterium]|nr:sigma 54-interacting transcriptional regulator [Candidatus Krumholzibacteria bacterium]